jgi:hypothetical protein
MVVEESAWWKASAGSRFDSGKGIQCVQLLRATARWIPTRDSPGHYSTLMILLTVEINPVRPATA